MPSSQSSNSQSPNSQESNSQQPTPQKNGRAIALLPIGIFLVLYLGLGILFEYVLKIEQGFYQIPIVVVFLIALLIACVQNKKVSLDNKLVLMGKGIGDKTIVTMIIIFMLAGIFAGICGRESASSVAYCLLSVVPAKWSVAILFVASCFVSLAMGTSVGTITLIVPIAIQVNLATGFSAPFCIAAVMGGAMFGDNLSFISDTTIAACQGQNCQMKDKFRENFKIALPAAIVTLVIIVAMSFSMDPGQINLQPFTLVQIIPYVLALACGLIGINVFIVLVVGIVSGAVVMLATNAATPLTIVASTGAGVSGMFETTMVAVLVAAICALVREHGGFSALLNGIYKLFKSQKGGMFGIGILVGLMDIATANNTVAIVMSNPIASEMAQKYDISKRKTASLLDTFSCVFQGIIPYGAQMLVAIAGAASIGVGVSAFDIIPMLFYPFMLLISSLIFIFIIPNKQCNKDA